MRLRGCRAVILVVDGGLVIRKSDKSGDLSPSSYVRLNRGSCLLLMEGDLSVELYEILNTQAIWND